MIIEIDLKFVLWYKCTKCEREDSIHIDSIDQLQDAIKKGVPFCYYCNRKLEFADCEMIT